MLPGNFACIMPECRL